MKMKNPVNVMLSVTFFVIGISFLLNIMFNKGETKFVTATIVSIYEDGGWECDGVKTAIKTEGGFVDSVCGSYGNVGDKFKGYWTEGAAEKSLNGFSLTK